MSDTPAANWYPDPANPALLRYWDGARWTDHTHDPNPQAVPAALTAQAAPPPVPAALTQPTELGDAATEASAVFNRRGQFPQDQEIRPLIEHLFGIGGGRSLSPVTT